MKKVLAIALLSLPLSACYTTDPALTGAVVGGATGAAIGGVATGEAGGALVGGAVGATTRRRHRRSGLSSPDGAVRVRPLFRPGGLLSVLSRLRFHGFPPGGDPGFARGGRQ